MKKSTKNMRIKSIQKETVRTENSTEQKSLLNVFLTKPSGKCIQQNKKVVLLNSKYI